MTVRVGHAGVLGRPGGFTMVELIVVLILVGILGAIGAARFFNRSGFDADAYTEQTRAMLRYAQKLAVAQNRPVFVQAGTAGIALCYSAALPCVAADQVPTPAGQNSGSAATRGLCLANGAFAAGWYCEAPPAGTTLTVTPASQAVFYFNGLGRPYLAGDVITPTVDTSHFTGLTLGIGGEGTTRNVAVSSETGYVF
jgi:MSHA pilin protein MshC